MGTFIKSNDLVDKENGQAIEFRNPEEGIENDIPLDDTFRPCRRRIGSRSALESLSSETNLQRPPWEQSDLAVRTLDGRYHAHGISRKGLRVLEREGKWIVRAGGGTIRIDQLRKRTLEMTRQERNLTNKKRTRAASSNQEVGVSVERAAKRTRGVQLRPNSVQLRPNSKKRSKSQSRD